jgi:hypothetical protein
MMMKSKYAHIEVEMRVTSPYVYDMKDELRRIQREWKANEGRGTGAPIVDNFVHSRRSEGKTTALVEFIAERHLTLRAPQVCGVVSPSVDMAVHFERMFHEMFPQIRLPRVVCAEDARSRIEGAFRADHDVVEVYADEMLMMEPRFIKSIQNFVAGVGTIERATALRLDRW